MAPVLNMNGASAKSLIDAYVKAIQALDEAATKLAACAPHGRDFQTAKPGAYEQARTQHTERARSIENMRNDLESLALAVQAQQAERGR